MKQLFLLLAVASSLFVFSQKPTSKQLLEKTIAYHDPDGKWPTFKGDLHITMEIPQKPNRVSNIHIDLPKQFFSVQAKTDNKISKYVINKDSITIFFNGVENPSKNILKEEKLSNKSAKLYQNYYTYLYGLPMKLKDSGTIIHDNVVSKSFKGKSYWVLKVSYEKEIGADTWYFYFNKNTYAMEVYQFFHDESKNDGEYILLSDIATINGIKMPKNRAWYMNKDNKYLGTDILK